MTNYTSADFGKATNILEQVVGINELSNGWFAGLLIIFLFLIILGITYTFTGDLLRSFTTSSFIVFIIGILLWAIELISLFYVIIPLVFLILGIMVLYFAPRR
jgi:hypothetical protein